MSSNRFVVVLDLGSSRVRAHVYDAKANIVHQEVHQLTPLHPEPNQTEYCPNEIWSKTRSLLQAVFAKYNPGSVSGLGITVMRTSTILWDRNTGEHLTNMISWQDLRAVDEAKTWNNALSVRMFRTMCSFLHMLTRKPKFLAASVMQFKSLLPLVQLLKLFRENPDWLERAHRGEICFGGNESWLLWKLTGQKVHASEYSCAGTTGIYDPFGLEWSSMVIKNLVHLPMSIFPPVRPTSSVHGVVDKALFGAEIPITCIIGDQSAATFGERCFQPNSVKVTLGTGTFLDWNTGPSAFASMKGLYPVIGWFMEGDPGPVYLIEGAHPDTGTTLDWGVKMGFYDRVQDTARIAQEVTDSAGVYFVPSFTGLGVPFNDPTACGALVGLSSQANKRHITRAILEAVIFQTKVIAESFVTETGLRPSKLHCNGGVAANDFVLQGIADLLECEVVRVKSCEATSRGCAFLAGLTTGFWTQQDLANLELEATRFTPSPERLSELSDEFQRWKLAVKRCLRWL